MWNNFALSNFKIGIKKVASDTILPHPNTTPSTNRNAI